MARRRPAADGDQVEEMIGAWRRERPGLDLSGMAVVARLLRVAHRVDEAQDEVFSALGLKPGWPDVLGAPRRARGPYPLAPPRLAAGGPVSTARPTKPP